MTKNASKSLPTKTKRRTPITSKTAKPSSMAKSDSSSNKEKANTNADTFEEQVSMLKDSSTSLNKESCSSKKSNNSHATVADRHMPRKSSKSDQPLKKKKPTASAKPSSKKKNLKSKSNKGSANAPQMVATTDKTTVPTTNAVKPTKTKAAKAKKKTSKEGDSVANVGNKRKTAGRAAQTCSKKQRINDGEDDLWTNDDAALKKLIALMEDESWVKHHCSQLKALYAVMQQKLPQEQKKQLNKHPARPFVTEWLERHPKWKFRKFCLKGGPRKLNQMMTYALQEMSKQEREWFLKGRTINDRDIRKSFCNLVSRIREEWNDEESDSDTEAANLHEETNQSKTAKNVESKDGSASSGLSSNDASDEEDQRDSTKDEEYDSEQEEEEPDPEEEADAFSDEGSDDDSNEYERDTHQEKHESKDPKGVGTDEEETESSVADADEDQNDTTGPDTDAQQDHDNSESNKQHSESKNQKRADTDEEETETQNQDGPGVEEDETESLDQGRNEDTEGGSDGKATKIAYLKTNKSVIVESEGDVSTTDDGNKKGDGKDETTAKESSDTSVEAMVIDSEDETQSQ